MPLAIVLSPFILLSVAGWLGARYGERIRLLAVIPEALTAYLAFTAAARAFRGNTVSTRPMNAGNRHVFTKQLGRRVVRHFSILTDKTRRELDVGFDRVHLR
jgi:hypothetical protein